MHLSRQRRQSVKWSPRFLFGNSEVGAWYDPSDYSTLFQDSAGRTPVTAVEQPVGLMLDKSKGLALGTELNPNPVTGSSMSNNGTSPPTSNPNTTYAGSACRSITFPAASSGYAVSSCQFTDTSVNVVINNWYYNTWEVAFSRPLTGSERITLYQQTSAGAYLNFTAANSSTAFVSITGYGVATSSASGYFAAYIGGTLLSPVTVYVRLCSIKLVSGNHASQSTSTKRPVLSARYNLLTYSEQFDNAAWTSYGINLTANQATAPDGTVTADLAVPKNGTFSNVEILNTVTGASSATLTMSVYVKSAGANYAVVGWIYDGTHYCAASFNLSTGALSYSAAAAWTLIGTSITPLANSWYRISVTATSPSSATYSTYPTVIPRINPWNSGQPGGSETGDGVNGVYFWGAQLNYGSTATPYQQITTATSYNSTGFLPYLSFDGVDDALATASIDFTGTNKMSAFSGLVNKSDAAYGIMCELSTDYNSNNGVFSFITANPAGVFTYASKGTSGNGRTASGYPAPTNPLVITGQSNIGAPSISIRVNGTTIDSSTSTQGTGNYGNYALYIGARAGATNPFNGNLYSLIIRGATTSAADITSIENWVNVRTGAY